MFCLIYYVKYKYYKSYKMYKITKTSFGPIPYKNVQNVHTHLAWTNSQCNAILAKNLEIHIGYFGGGGIVFG